MSEDQDEEVARLRRELRDAHLLVAAILTASGGSVAIQQSVLTAQTRWPIIERQYDPASGAVVFRSV